MRSHILCSVCTNAIFHKLSSLPWEAWMKPNIKDCVEQWTFLMIMFLKLNHPRSPKIMMKLCADSSGFFQKLCFSLYVCLIGILPAVPVIDITKTLKGPIEHRDMASQFTRLFLLSIKYWNQNHVDFYVNHFYGAVEHWRKELKQSPLWNEVQDGYRVQRQLAQIPETPLSDADNYRFLLSQVNYYLECTQYFVAKRSKKIKWKGRCLKNCYGEFKLAVKLQRGPVLCCASSKCSKYEIDCDEMFKVCGGCKMTYFCSRSCQKRAWPQHKQLCRSLSRCFQL